MDRLAGRRALEGGTFRSFIMFTLLNLILLANEFVGHNLVVAYDEGEAGIELTRFQVPAHVKPGELRRLTCQFKLHGATLHAMKLFKDDQEFFRLTPANQKMTFPVVGVHVDLGRSREGEVWLKINKRSGGQYKCQVLIEGTFKSVSLAKRMEVVQGDSNQATATTLGGAWQHHPAPQHQHQQQQNHQDPASTRPYLSRLPHSAVQQHPSHLYGLGSVMGGGGGGGNGSQGPSVSLNTNSFVLLVWSLLVATIATTITTTSTSLSVVQESSTRKKKKRRRKRPREKKILSKV